eukprot:TRINITY_DN10869_c0_g1_i2.p1 TRINITY_DN10869_c0_g1~~TRINITY_DN10869_c0_g1_i2.p1  ORF type:complete len:389 (-),score=62.35 TRINITY_DN10869_c0_g1_i2:84-1250(-)
MKALPSHAFLIQPELRNVEVARRWRSPSSDSWRTSLYPCRSISSDQRTKADSRCACAATTVLCLELERLVARRRRKRLQGVQRRATAREPQVLPFVDPQTGSEVVLVACMHYNPCSVGKAAEVTRQLSKSGKLGAVVLETCPSRWEALVADQPRGSFQRMLLDNEFQAAYDEADMGGRPVVFGDQGMDEMGRVVSSLLKTAVNDLATPFDGGWQRSFTDIRDGLKKLQQRPQKEQEGSSRCADDIDLSDFLDFKLIVGFPVAIFRYAMTLLIKSPRLFAANVASLAVLKLLLTEAPDQLPGSNPLADLVFIVVEVLTWRVLLGVLLADRDAILAKSIGDACASSGGPGRTVVAVLGALHCNGVKRRLLDRVEVLDAVDACIPSMPESA